VASQDDAKGQARRAQWGLTTLGLALGFVFAIQTSAVFAQAQPFNGSGSDSAGASGGVESVSGKREALPSLNAAGTSMAQPPIAQPSAESSTGGNVAELKRRIAAKQLAELRTVYNGSYGASLLIANDAPTYYVALFERKNFWRVIKTDSDVRAEAVFADFARQTSDLASTEIQSMKLAAERSGAEQLIALNRDRAAQIQADLAVQQQQQQEVSERQRVAQTQAVTLEAENAKAQSQLDDLRRQLADLQRQADAGLPSGSGSSSTRKVKRQ
jgi:hypothetical protein